MTNSAEKIAELAVDESRLREKALTLAVGHFRKINFTGSPERIVALANAFLEFLKEGS